MSSSPPNENFTYPDPSLYGRTQLRTTPYHHQYVLTDSPSVLANPPIATTPPAPFALDPALYGPVTARVPAPAAPPTPQPNVSAMRPSAAGRQPFPKLSLGLLAPVELTRADVLSWNEHLRGNDPC